MQIHELKPKITKKKDRRVGRGGKRGTFSGHGSKGQKARAGTRIRPGFRGGDNPIWKLFPKQRGSTKKVDIKHVSFQLHRKKPGVINLESISKHFKDGDVVSPKTLLKIGAIKRTSKIKILGDGELTKKLTFSDLKFSKLALEKIQKAGGVIK